MVARLEELGVDPNEEIRWRTAWFACNRAAITDARRRVELDP